MPEDDVVGGAPSSEAAKSDLEILNEEPPAEEAPSEEVEIPPVEEEAIQFDDLTEEEPEITPEPSTEPIPAEQEDAQVAEGQLRFKDVRAKYPTVFKEFPQLANALKNDRAYSEIFSSPEDAKDAARVANYFNTLETEILQGNAKKLLGDMKSGDPEGYKKFVRNVLPTVREDSMELFAEITLPAINDLLRSAVRDAQANENQNLRNAALYIAKYLYGKPEIPGETRPTAPSPDETKLQQERQQFWEERRGTFQNETYGDAREVTMAEIAKGIDNDKSISPFLKKSLKDAIFTEVDQLLGKDARHLRGMTALWRKAEASGYSKESRKELSNAYLRGAKALIPAVRQKLKSEAGIQTKVQPQQQATKRTNLPQSSSGAPQSGRKIPSARDVDWGRTSDRDFLEGRYVPKRRSR